MTAKRDITVYKCLVVRAAECGGRYEFVSEHCKDGARFECKICGITVSGHVSVCAGSVFFCHDEPKARGACPRDMKGHAYAWVFDDTLRIATIKIDGKRICKASTLFQTPYRNMNVELKKEYSSKLDSPRNREINYGLHSLAKMKDAPYAYNDVIAKCVIPKGSKYYVGKFGGMDAYASDRLRYVRIIKSK